MRSPETSFALGLAFLLVLFVGLGSAPLVSAQVSEEQLAEVTDFIHDCQDNYGDKSDLWWSWNDIQDMIWHKLGAIFYHTIDPTVFDSWWYIAGELRDLVRSYGVPPPYIPENEIYAIIQYVEIPDQPEGPDVPDIPVSIPIPLMLSFAVIVGMAFIGFNISRTHDPMPGLFMLFAGVVLSWSVGWLPTWIFATAIALIAMTSAALWGKLFRGR